MFLGYTIIIVPDVLKLHFHFGISRLQLQHDLEGNLQIHTHQQVFWLDVPVHDVEAVEVLDGACQIEQHTTGVTLCVLVGGGDGVKQVTPLRREHL